MTDLAKPNGLASAVDIGGSSPRAALVASHGETAVFASRPHRMGEEAVTAAVTLASLATAIMTSVVPTFVTSPRLPATLHLYTQRSHLGVSLHGIRAPL